MNYTVFYEIHITNALSKESIPFILVDTTKGQRDNQLTALIHRLLRYTYEFVLKVTYKIEILISASLSPS